jgi:hypothetical protein
MSSYRDTLPKDLHHVQPQAYRDRIKDRRVLVSRKGKTTEEWRRDLTIADKLPVGTGVTFESGEHVNLKAFADLYRMDLQTLLARAARLFVDTVQSYPHTQIAKDLTAPRGEGRKWDERLRLTEIDPNGE